MSNKGSRRPDAVLIGIALLAAFLNMYGIWKDQTANAYYTSAVSSMLQSFHNFFYASFDPGGFVTVDKPPVTFWIQTASAYLLGLHGWSVILPQALAGVGSVLLLYVLVKPSFGKTAARLSALVAACTPIAAAVSRTNDVDSILVCTLLVAAWLLFRAIKTERWTWAAASFAVVGLAFNMKMLQAYMVLPAFYLFFLIAFKVNWKKKLGVLAAATAVLLATSLSWAVIVDSIPQENRPYIGSSQTNSVLELALGYNGISRLTGNKGMERGGQPPGFIGEGPQGQQPQDGQQEIRNRGDQSQNAAALRGDDSRNGSQASADNQNGSSGFNPGQNAPGQNGGRDSREPTGGGGAFNTGKAGPLRLFQSALSGQASWLLPFVFVAVDGLLAGVRKGRKLTPKEKETVFWLAWLLPVMAFFSVAGFFHSYYLIMLAPPIAALAGAGGTELWTFYRNREGWKTWLLPAGLFATTLFEIYVLKPYTQEIGIGWPIGVGAAGIGLSLVLVLAVQKGQLAKAAVLGGIIAMLAAPLFWAATPILYGGNSMIPEAGPKKANSDRPPGMQDMMRESADAKLLDYVTQNNTGEKYLFATTNAMSAAPYIIQTGKPVMAMGGFSGSDPILTVTELEQMVADKEVKYFLLPSGNFGGGSGFGGGRGGSAVQDWIRQHAVEVPKEQWQSVSAGFSANRTMGGSLSLYEISPS